MNRDQTSCGVLKQLMATELKMPQSTIGSEVVHSFADQTAKTREALMRRIGENLVFQQCPSGKRRWKHVRKWQTCRAQFVAADLKVFRVKRTGCQQVE